MKYIRKRKDGRYEARKTILGKRFSFCARTKEACYKLLKDALSDFKKNNKLPKQRSLKQKELENEKKTTFKFSTLATTWAETYKKPFVAENTYKDILRKLKTIESTTIDISIKTLTPDVLQTYLNTLPNNRTKEILITYLNACLKKISRTYKISNPMDEITKAPKINNIRKAFGYQEQVKVLDSIQNSDIRDAILIYLFTGMRKNELNHKNLKDDLQEDGTLKIRCEKKRGKEQFRFVDVPPRTRELILNATLYNPSTISDKFRLILDNLGIPKGYGLHTLRHTFTTNHFYLGTPDKYLQEWLGHENVSVTRKHYMSIDRSLTKEKVLSLYKDYYYIVTE